MSSDPGETSDQVASAGTVAGNIPHDGVLSAPASAQVVSPTATPVPAVQTPAAAMEPAPAAGVQPQPSSPAPVTATPVTSAQSSPVPDMAQTGFYRAQQPDPALQNADMAEQAHDDVVPVQWVAGADPGAHPRRSAKWYAAVILAAVLLSAIVFLVGRDKVSTAFVGLAILAFAFLGAKRFHPVQYGVDRRGVMIGGKFYAYAMFRSFSVIEDSFGKAIVLSPLQRFMPLLNLRFDANTADVAGIDHVVEILSDHLPMEEHRADMMDHISRSIRF